MRCKDALGNSRQKSLTRLTARRQGWLDRCTDRGRRFGRGRADIRACDRAQPPRRPDVPPRTSLSLLLAPRPWPLRSRRNLRWANGLESSSTSNLLQIGAAAVTEIKVAEGVGFEPTDSLLSSAFKALALGRYANPPEPASHQSPPVPVRFSQHAEQTPSQPHAKPHAKPAPDGESYRPVSLRAR
jgi:hypothetical protein